MLIAGLVRLGYLTSTQTYTTDDVSNGVQDFVVCIEMFIAAIAHIYIFPANEFKEKVTYGPGIRMARVGSVFNPSDLVRDMHTHFVRPVSNKARAQKCHSCFSCCPCTLCGEDEVGPVEVAELSSKPDDRARLAPQSENGTSSVGEPSSPVPESKGDNPPGLELTSQNSTESEGISESTTMDGLVSDKEKQ